MGKSVNLDDLPREILEQIASYLTNGQADVHIRSNGQLTFSYKLCPEQDKRCLTDIFSFVRTCKALYMVMPCVFRKKLRFCFFDQITFEQFAQRSIKDEQFIKRCIGEYVEQSTEQSTKDVEALKEFIKNNKLFEHYLFPTLLVPRLLLQLQSFDDSFLKDLSSTKYLERITYLDIFLFQQDSGPEGRPNKEDIKRHLSGFSFDALKVSIDSPVITTAELPMVPQGRSRYGTNPLGTKVGAPSNWPHKRCVFERYELEDGSMVISRAGASTRRARPRRGGRR
ncbi:hypothetical protein DER44DRAFT_752969 [Fusarium oxysporum]|nr:hypothetical protein DER44DRAFT_752969 [Fusarium oxysporum]